MIARATLLLKYFDLSCLHLALFSNLRLREFLQAGHLLEFRFWRRATGYRHQWRYGKIVLSLVVEWMVAYRRPA